MQEIPGPTCPTTFQPIMTNYHLAVTLRQDTIYLQQSQGQTRITEDPIRLDLMVDLHRRLGGEKQENKI